MIKSYCKENFVYIIHVAGECDRNFVIASTYSVHVVISSQKHPTGFTILFERFLSQAVLIAQKMSHASESMTFSPCIEGCSFEQL